MRDQLTKILADEMEKKKAEDSIIKWIDSNKIMNEKDEPITFDEHPFLIQIYTDFSNGQVQEKCAQVGSSTCAIIKSFYLMKTKGYSVIHTLPTVDFSGDFVRSKVDPMVRTNKVLFNVTRKTDSIRHKEVGYAHLFYRGTHKETEGITISADVLINDEYDRSNLSVIGVFESRLDRSEYRRKWLFSNPTVPNYGINYLYSQSKQYHWFITCSHCGAMQYMRWPNSLDFKNKRFICVKCRKEIYNEDRINGMWVAKYRKRDVNGYWLSQLFCTWHSAAEIIYKYDNQKRDVFYNFTLGSPYEGSDVVVKREHIMRCLSNNTPRSMIKVMGIDQGGTFYISLGTADGIERLYTVGSWEEVEKEIARQDPMICVVDGLPETNEVKKLQKKFGGGKVFPAFYKDKPDDPRIIRWERQTKDRRTAAVYIDRYRSMDDLIGEIYKGRLNFFMTMSNPNIELVVKHFESLYRTEETNKAGQVYYVWKSSSKQDHFVHAINYWKVALSRVEHLENMEREDAEEDNRPYDKFETPEERLGRLDNEHAEAGGMPGYLQR